MCDFYPTGSEDEPIVKCAASRAKKRIICFKTAVRLIKEFLEFNEKLEDEIERGTAEDSFTVIDAYAHVLNETLYDLMSEIDVQNDWLNRFDRHQLDAYNFPKLCEDSKTTTYCKFLKITREEIDDKHESLYRY